MRAITLWEPFATLIAVGDKTFETRSRPPSGAIGERIAIHAGAREDYDVSSRAGIWTHSKEIVATAVIGWAGQVGEQRGDTVLFRRVLSLRTDLEILDPRVGLTLSENDQRYGDFSVGRWAWSLHDVRRLTEPVAVRGRQGIWTLDPDVAYLVRERGG